MGVQYCVDYLGWTILDRRFSSSMVQWVIADIQRRRSLQKINISVEDGQMIGCRRDGTSLFAHPLSGVTRFCHESSNVRTFMYLLKDDAADGLQAHLFKAAEFEDVVEIFQSMKEGLHAPRSHSSAASLTSLCSDISPSNSQFFEVLYVGKIKVSHRHVPETFIDDALDRIQQYEQDKQRKLLEADQDLVKSKSLEMGRKISNAGEIVAPGAPISSTHLISAPNQLSPTSSLSTSAPTRQSPSNHLTSAPTHLSPTSSHSTSAPTRQSPSNHLTSAPTHLSPTSSHSTSAPTLLNPNTNHNISAPAPQSPPPSIHNTSTIPGNPFLVPGSDSRIPVVGAAAVAPVPKKNDCDRNTVPILAPPPSKNATGDVNYRRNRSGSLGVIETMKPKKSDDGNHNRTMLFYVGRQDIKLISPDRKQVLLHKMLKDVTTCTQGVKKAEHFGLVSREVDAFVGYVFRCESEAVAEDVVSAINQSFNYVKDHKPTRQPVLSCEHCPMVWYHKLCAEIENLGEKKCQSTILQRIESLPEEDQDIIHTKLLGAESSDIKDQVDFLMILLRAHCEAKQAKHLHDTVENRSEFLNQYLGSGTIFMKAKRSLTSSFDQLLKRKGSNFDVMSSQSNSKESLHKRSVEHIDEPPPRRCSTVGTTDMEVLMKELKILAKACEEDDKSLRESSEEREPQNSQKKQSLVDIAAITVNNQKIEKHLRSSQEKEMDSLTTPMIDIFRKVGSSPKSGDEGYSPDTPSASWRQAIYNRVVTPGKPSELDGVNRKKTSVEYRLLWRKAINQQVLLIRMEKENARLRARQEEATVKRIKLEYDELGWSSKQYMGIWDLMAKDTRISSSRCDAQMLLQAIRQGVPRGKRGDVWNFLASQYCMKQPPFDATKFPNYDVPYEDLLKKLTSCQHAILIDLGRTFPNHPYFASPLGPGQLALFNLLKAYSLLDPEVGYCQGLSFVAAVLLLHMPEESAFLLLRHLMFRRGLRKPYLPDMAALQVHLYQLSRLLHDIYPQLYKLFDEHEIAPTLYAAPWILTLFASQFPLGFVTRVFDLLFLENTTDVIFRVILSLLDEHSEKLLKLTCFEDIMEYLKIDIPKVDGPMLEKVMKQVLSMDISKHLHEYEVEYHVLQEEMTSVKPEKEQLKKMALENKRLTDQNLALIEQLEVVNQSANRLEKARTNQQSTVTKLETQIRNLEITISTLAEFIEDIGVEHKDIEIPGDIRRLIANLQLAEQRSTKLLKAELNTKKKLDKSSLLKRSQTSMGFYEQRSHENELYTADELPNGTRYGDHIPRKNSIADSPKPVLKGVPLRVIIDEDDEKKPEPSNFAKITSGMSSFFNSQNNKQQKNAKNEFVNLEGRINDSFRPDFDEKKLYEKGFSSQVPDGVQKSFSGDIGSINLKTSVTNPDKKLKKAQSELAIKYSHPLDTGNDVKITYNGVTQLKSLKPASRKNQNIDLIQLSSDLLHVHEDIDIKNGQIVHPPLYGTVTEKF